MREVLVAALSTWPPAEVLVSHAESLWLAAVVVTFATALLLVARANLDPRPALWAGLCAVVAGLVAGRLWLVWFDDQPAVASALSDLLAGEKSVMGEVIGAGLGAALWLRFTRQPVLKYLDAAVPAAFVGYALGRAGCLLAGCCFGTPTALPWGIVYPPGSGPHLAQVAAGLIEPGAAASLAVHPIPLYHALLALLLCRLTLRAQGVYGRSVAVALIGYGIGRFLLELVRGDAIATALGLSVAQLGSVAFVFAGALLWWLGQRRVTTVAGATSPAPAG
jgi:phosphatidylglycerol:prolipoprotein diacylglycerol transferase